MERELEKTLLEIESSIKNHERRGNTHTQSVLEQARDIIEMCAQAARTPSELQQMLRKIQRKESPDKCGEWSRRKWYQEGYKDGSKDNDWIPVEERLPEVGEYVLGTTKSEEVLIFRYGWNSPHSKKMFFHLCGAAATIIAWRPLPEPYRTERSDSHDGE